MNIIIPFHGSKYSSEAGVDQIRLLIHYSDNKLTQVQFINSEYKKTIETSGSSDCAQQIQNEFRHYFLSAEFKFSLVCQLDKGTEFQRKVWQALIDIPVGEVISYGQLALKLNSGPRAVANACRSNPCPIIIPCHRVVSASGIGGYAGDTLVTQKTDIDFMAIKKWLLVHEKADFK